MGAGPDWISTKGFSHMQVDDGEPNALGNQSPILVPDGSFRQIRWSLSFGVGEPSYRSSCASSCWINSTSMFGHERSNHAILVNSERLSGDAISMSQITTSLGDFK